MQLTVTIHVVALHYTVGGGKLRACRGKACRKRVQLFSVGNVGFYSIAPQIQYDGIVISEILTTREGSYCQSDIKRCFLTHLMTNAITKILDINITPGKPKQDCQCAKRESR